MKCPRCGRDDITKCGFSHRIKGSFQRYDCKLCGFRFTEIADLFDYKKQKVSRELQAYMANLSRKGLSARDITIKIYKKYGIQLSHVTVSNTLQPLGLKYITLREARKLGDPKLISVLSSKNRKRIRKLMHTRYRLVNERKWNACIDCRNPVDINKKYIIFAEGLCHPECNRKHTHKLWQQG